MEGLPIVLSLILVLLVMAMAVFAASAFHALFKGCFALRHSLRANSYDFGNLLLKSPIVPGVSVVLAPPDASPESRALLRRLLDLTFGRHEVVLVLDGPSEPDLNCWVQEFHLYRQERAIPQDLPTAAIRGSYVSRDPIRLLMVDKEPGGVADAHNAGVNAARYPVIGLVDREVRPLGDDIQVAVRDDRRNLDDVVRVGLQARHFQIDPDEVIGTRHVTKRR